MGDVQRDASAGLGLHVSLTLLEAIVKDRFLPKMLRRTGTFDHPIRVEERSWGLVPLGRKAPKITDPCHRLLHSVCLAYCESSPGVVVDG